MFLDKLLQKVVKKEEKAAAKEKKKKAKEAKASKNAEKKVTLDTFLQKLALQQQPALKASHWSTSRSENDWRKAIKDIYQTIQSEEEQPGKDEL